MADGPIAGSDGVIPTYLPDDPWKTWALFEIWTGTTGANKYIAKALDYVRDPTTYQTWIVDHVDPVTYIPTLRLITPAAADQSVDDVNEVIYPYIGSLRAYYDKTTSPYTMSIDNRIMVPGSESKYGKVFLGSDTSDSGTVVSRVINNSGVVTSENITLEVVSGTNPTTGDTLYNMKSMPTFSVVDDIDDGEVVTAVFYTQAGVVTMMQQLVVVETTFVRPLSFGERYITSIQLDSPFISATDDTVIDMPMGVPISALNFQGVVNYSDGTSTTYPVDGTHFSLYGADARPTTVTGESIPLSLIYRLDTDERSYAINGSPNKTIGAAYTLKTTATNNSYAVKLYVYPVWGGSSVGYNTLKFYLLNLSRNIFQDVSSLITWDADEDAYDPLNYGSIQRRTVSIDLQTVSASFNDYTHSQVMDIILYGDATTTAVPWGVSQQGPDTLPYYTKYAVANLIDTNTVDIAVGTAGNANWLTRTYQSNWPLYDARLEGAAPDPTHVQVIYDGTTTEVAMEDWNDWKDAGVVIPTTVTTYTNLYLLFIKRITGSSDLLLSVSGQIILPYTA